MSVSIVIPARDEERLIGRSIEAALDAGAAVGGTQLIVVADTCTDATVAIARGYRHVDVIETTVANVGAARAIGVDAADGRWIATSDADSTVPVDWLVVHERLAADGADAVLGTVRPRRADLDDEQWAAWERVHSGGRSTGNIHGANLGFRRDAYLAVGGFDRLVEHEDVDLVGRLRVAGFAVVATPDVEVVTSGRTVGRTPGGFARYLRDDLRHPQSV